MNRAVFFVLLLFATAALLMWWTGGNEPQPSQAASSGQRQPDGIAEDLQVRQFDEQGQISLVVNAKSMRYFANAQETQLLQPRFELYDAQQQSPWAITADSATVTGQRLVDLKNNVIIRSLDDDARIRSVHTGNLALDLLNKTMSTDQPVTLQGPGFITTGVGLEASLEGQKMHLKSQVNTVYEQTNHP
ncbi:LPS export ABC transporter periplasmic protein LptC [Gallaecimonas sp. GXIMD1310]|uniref:LPS export ABC transporter periplasmic protein LptC n=1 Tax=Gallaecimonas sp. GXIMD1310 TaxID=3131926 RepID=UPI00324CE20A